MLAIITRNSYRKRAPSNSSETFVVSRKSADTGIWVLSAPSGCILLVKMSCFFLSPSNPWWRSCLCHCLFCTCRSSPPDLTFTLHFKTETSLCFTVTVNSYFAKGQSSNSYETYAPVSRSAVILHLGGYVFSFIWSYFWVWLRGVFV